ncbi:Leucine-rich repeat-containing protein 1 [Escovopsis weberi]|uniref:Leucine-rich repeat-containing protein 1 n=1 Tax=Escovopsis weberi TaxID=150374 RepID=A0A0M8N549_ESCWE|nr:Leucine-rich repeat-containing protein 1 [Escovopsis weberi]
MDEEEPLLPTLPAVSWNAGSQCISNYPRKRRKQRGRAASPLPLTSACESSDPAFFSSDDDPGLDNYNNQNRRKKRYIGSWFHQRPTSSESSLNEGPAHDLPLSKRTLTRQIDSGIYMGSDLTDYDDEPDEISDSPAPVRLLRQAARQAPTISPAERLAQIKIQDCLDRGHDCFDLYSLGLEELSGDTISRVGDFAYVPVVVRDVGFTHKLPEPQLLLANNRLTRLPGALFDLMHLRVLSLRGNQLTELPPAICKLPNLVSLNLSQNRLHSLPGELLDFLRPGTSLRDLTVFPNPFVQPTRPFDYIRNDDHPASRPGFAAPKVRYAFRRGQEEELSLLPKILSRRIARSPVQRLSSSGVVLSDFKLALGGGPAGVPTTVEVFGGNGDDHPADIDRVGAARRSRAPLDRAESLRPSVVPSLVEAILRSCHQSKHLHHLESYIPEDLGHLRALIRRAAEQREQGGLTCSRCRKAIVVPTMEWIEWRELRTIDVHRNPDVLSVSVGQLCSNKAEMAVPFLRRACSWRCGPDGHKQEPEWKAPDKRLEEFFNPPERAE